MQNLTIIDNDISRIQKIINKLSNSIENIKLYKIFFEVDTNILDFVDSKETDIIIVNIETYGEKIIKYIKNNNNNNFYRKSIIFLYKNKKEVNEFLKEEYKPYIFKCVETEDIETLLKNIRLLVYVKENTYEETIIRTKIERNLKRIGFNLNNIGTKYIIEIVEYLYKNNIEFFKLNDLYNMLAKKYNKSLNTIKGDITSSTKNMKKGSRKNVIIDFFSYLELVKMPTITEIVTVLYEKL